MSGERKAPEAFSLRRWSQRKLAASRDERNAQKAREATPTSDANARRDVPAPRAPAPGVPAAPEQQGHAAPIATGSAATGDAAPALPPADSLTFDSDFTAFMQPGIDENVRRSALRKLLRDPRFNVMDGLDVYIDDYSKPDPIPPEMLRSLVQARYLFDPPKTRVNDEGFVEDVAEEAPGTAGTTPDAGEAADSGNAPRIEHAASAVPPLRVDQHTAADTMASSTLSPDARSEDSR